MIKTEQMRGDCEGMKVILKPVSAVETCSRTKARSQEQRNITLVVRVGP